MKRNGRGGIRTYLFALTSNEERGRFHREVYEVDFSSLSHNLHCERGPLRSCKGAPSSNHGPRTVWYKYARLNLSRSGLHSEDVWDQKLHLERWYRTFKERTTRRFYNNFPIRVPQRSNRANRKIPSPVLHTGTIECDLTRRSNALHQPSSSRYH